MKTGCKAKINDFIFRTSIRFNDITFEVKYLSNPVDLKTIMECEDEDEELMTNIIETDVKQWGKIHLNNVYKRYGLRKLEKNHLTTRNVVGSLTGVLGVMVLMAGVFVVVRRCFAGHAEDTSRTATTYIGGILSRRMSRDFPETEFGSAPALGNTKQLEEKITLNDQIVDTKKRRRDTFL